MAEQVETIAVVRKGVDSPYIVINKGDEQEGDKPYKGKLSEDEPKQEQQAEGGE